MWTAFDSVATVAAAQHLEGNEATAVKMQQIVA